MLVGTKVGVRGRVEQVFFDAATSVHSILKIPTIYINIFPL